MLSTITLFTTLTIILLAAGWVVGGIIGMGTAFALAAAINIFSYWYSDKIVLKIYKAKPYNNAGLERMLAYLSKEAKIPKPSLYIVEKETPNAFATGRNPEKGVIAITRGILQLEEKEVKAILSHEIAHIKHRDMLSSTVAATIAGAISYLAHFGYMSLVFSDNRQQGNLIGLVFIMIFAPLAALLVKLAISRSMEFRADWTGVLLTKDPDSMVSALKKISKSAEQSPSKTGPRATSHMWIVNPFKQDWFTRMFSTHPPMQRRIERIAEINTGMPMTD